MEMIQTVHTDGALFESPRRKHGAHKYSYSVAELSGFRFCFNQLPVFCVANETFRQGFLDGHLTNYGFLVLLFEGVGQFHLEGTQIAYFRVSFLFLELKCNLQPVVARIMVFCGYTYIF